MLRTSIRCRQNCVTAERLCNVSQSQGDGRIRCYSSSTSSVNPAEVAHFNKLASTWWNPQGPSRLLHQMNPVRHDFISLCFAAFPRSPRPTRYLDVGCGGGIFAESAARLPRIETVHAIDPSEEVLQVAKGHARRDPLLLRPGLLTYENKSIEQLTRPQSAADQFNVVSLFEVLEHIRYPSNFLESCLPFVSPGGWLVLSTIARTWTSWLTTKVVAEDLARIVPQGTHDWNKYVNCNELQGWFTNKSGWGAGGGMKVMGVVYVPGLGWKAVPASERVGNYFFGIRKNI